MKTANISGNENGLYVKYSYALRLSNEKIERVTPQVGHGWPVNIRIGHTS